MNKRKAIIFYTYLPPWRIDVFNEMTKFYNLKIIFLNSGSEGFTYNRDRLSKLLKVPHEFWKRGIKINGKVFRSGIYKFLKKEKPEVVFSHEYSPTSILCSFLKKSNILKFTLIITTSDNVKMAKSVKGLKKLARQFVLSEASGIIVYSDSVMQYYKKYFPFLNVEICPNIQNPKTLLSYKSQFNELTNRYKKKYILMDKKIILYVGRFVKVKGLDLLLEAYSKIFAPDYKLVLIGDGIERNNLEKQIEKLDLQERVILPGFFDGASLYAWYELANFFVLPSRYEPFGAVINEALVFGCPVITSKYVGALDFISTGNNGFIFDPLNEQEFVEILEKSMKEFEIPLDQKPNLMIHTFNQYVNSFKSILND